MNKLWMIAIIAILSGCARKENDEQSMKLLSLMKDLRIDTHKNRFVILVPAQGCEGCIDKMLNFAFSNHYRDSVSFILTGKSEKDIMMRIKIPELVLPSVYKDTQGIALARNLCWGYPVVYELYSNQIVGLAKVNGENADSIITKLCASNACSADVSTASTVPLPLGGIEKFNDRLTVSISKKLKEKKLTGSVRVVLHFFVGTDGNVKKIKMVKGAGKEVDEAILDAFRSVDVKWEPAMQDNTAVEKDVYLPVQIKS